MGCRSIRLVLVPWLLLLLFIFLFGQAYYGSSSRYSHIFKVNPKSHQNSPRSFFGALPKTMPIPPSGPSKKHNDIGLQSSTRFP
ncbi:hypothetical protein DITRI_Ditri05aG0105100 [Diplodiscus trichospermus]